ncbi:MAG: AAA family ATPase [Aminivibrio sp.]|nr:AAA family ATPase [Aminivibrio sp.]
METAKDLFREAWAKARKKKEPTEPRQEERRSSFSLRRIGDIPLIEPEFLVDDLFEADALALFFGESGCKKSFVALDLAASIATGAPFHGKQTKEGAVIYLAGEGNAGMTRRAEAWSRHRGISLKEAPLFLSSRAALLMDEHSARLVEEEVDRIVQEVGNPLLIIIDTVARSIVGGDENSAKDVSVFVERVDALRRKYGASALLVHHSGIIDKGRLRGSSAWKGALDAEFLIESSGDMVTVEAKKMKDAPIPESFSFKAVEYVILETRSGKAITSLALEPTDEKPAKKEKLSPTLKRALDSYHAAAAEKGLLDEQGNFAGVHIEDWRPYFYETATADSQSGKRGSFNRGIKGLVEGGYLTVRNDVYSLANPKETPPENEYGKRLKEVKERFSVSRRFNGVSCNASCGEEAFQALHHPIGCNAKRPHETLEAGETEKKEPGEVENSFLEDEEAFQGEGARIEFFDTFATGPEEPKADQPAPKKSYLELLTGGDGDEDEKVS